MNAQAVVASLLEADPDAIDPKADAGRYMSTIDFDEGVEDIVRDARILYKRLEAQGVIGLLNRHQGRVSSTTGFDNLSIAQAVLKIALEERGSLGAKNVYRLIQRWR